MNKNKETTIPIDLINKITIFLIFITIFLSIFGVFGTIFCIHRIVLPEYDDNPQKESTIKFHKEAVIVESKHE